MTQPPFDCIIVGGGPAGATAAIYLARFHLSVLVIDSGGSRAALIPKTRNHAGFPEGIAGEDLLSRMREQARLYGAAVLSGEASNLCLDDDLFEVSVGSHIHSARAVLIATGVVNHRPAMEQRLHDEALARGLLRYCPICDGFEVTDMRVGVIGTGRRGIAEAMFLRSYTADVTLIAPGGGHHLDAEQRRDLHDAEIAIVDGPVEAFAIEDDRISFRTPAKRLLFDSVYPAMGSDIRSDLAAAIGARTTNDGCLITDEHQRTNIAGLYAAGDVVKGLDQISHAMGQGGVAATTIRNDLAANHPLRREGVSAGR